MSVLLVHPTKNPRVVFDTIISFKDAELVYMKTWVDMVHLAMESRSILSCHVLETTLCYFFKHQIQEWC